MKKVCLLLLILVVCYASFGIAHVLPQKPIPSKKLYVYAEETIKEDDIQVAVIGNAKKHLIADSAVVRAYFESTSTQFANNKNIEFDMIKEKIIESGVGDEDVSLDYFSSFPRQENEQKYFKNCYSFSIYIKDLTKTGDVLNILKSCSVQILDVRYQVSNLKNEYDQVLDSAMEDAKTKASQIYNTDNIEVVEVKEKSVRYSSTLLDDEQSSIDLQAQVEVVFGWGYL